MSDYKPGHKIISGGKLYKIEKMYDTGHCSCCTEDGCSSLVLLNRVNQSYIGDADPQYYSAAKIIRDEAIKLKSNLNFEQICGLETCDMLDKTIEFAETIMAKFKYIPE